MDEREKKRRLVTLRTYALYAVGYVEYVLTFGRTGHFSLALI